MKIAALIQVHKKPEMLGALTQRLNTEFWKVYVHVDAKSDIAPFKAAVKNANFLTDRRKVYWAGFSQVAASMALLKAGLADPENTHFYLMSGQCYPIKTDEEIKDSILAAPAGNFVSMWKMPVPHKPLIRLSQRYAYDIGNDLLRRAANRLLSYLPPRDVGKLLHGIHPWGGSSWWLFSRAAATKILDFVDQNPWFTRAFRLTSCPDEIFFQTLVAHLGITVANETPTKTHFIEGHYHPVNIDPQVLSELRKGWHFSARKFEQPGNTFGI